MTEGEKRLLSELVITHVYIFMLRQSVGSLVEMVDEALAEVMKMSETDCSAERASIRSAFVTFCRAMGPGQEGEDKVNQLLRLVRHVRTSAETPIEAAARLRVLRELGVDDLALEKDTFTDRAVAH